MPRAAPSKAGSSQRASGLAINLGQIQTFLALVEEGSVARASIRLGLSHSTISAHIKATSDELGQKLFNRPHGGLILTAAGLETYNKLKPLVTHAGFKAGLFSAIRQKWRLQSPWKSSNAKSSPKWDRNRGPHCDRRTPIDLS